MVKVQYHVCSCQCSWHSQITLILRQPCVRFASHIYICIGSPYSASLSKHNFHRAKLSYHILQEPFVPQQKRGRTYTVYTKFDIPVQALPSPFALKSSPEGDGISILPYLKYQSQAFFENTLNNFLD